MNILCIMSSFYLVTYFEKCSPSKGFPHEMLRIIHFFGELHCPFPIVVGLNLSQGLVL